MRPSEGAVPASVALGLLMSKASLQANSCHLTCKSIKPVLCRRDDARALREDQQQLQQQLRKAASAGQLAQQNLLACRTEAAKLPALLKSNEALSARHEKLVADKAALQQRCDTSQELLNAKDKSSAAERQPKTRARQSIALLQEELDSMRALQVSGCMAHVALT